MNYNDSEYIENPDLLPFCACGRRVSECDGTRTGCGKGGPGRPYGLAAVIAAEKAAKTPKAPMVLDRTANLRLIGVFGTVATYSVEASKLAAAVTELTAAGLTVTGVEMVTPALAKVATSTKPVKAAPKNSAEQLAGDIAEAKKNARAAVAGLKDEGTCNLDSVKVRIGRCSKTFEKACKAVGVDADRTSESGTYNVAGGASVGMASRATKFCELIRDELRAKGHDANVCYYTD